MKKITMFFVSLLFLSLTVVGISAQPASARHIDPSPGCDQNSFLGFPYWYKYVYHETVHDDLSDSQICNVKLKGISDVWLVAAAVIETLIRVASMIAIGFIIYGGASYIISQGAPDKTKKAQATIINAVIGLAISIVAAAVISFIAGRF